MGRIIRTALLLLGVLLVFTLFHRIGLTPVMSAVARLSWSLPLLLLVPACLIVTCDTLGWRFAFRRDGVPFGALLRARQLHDAARGTRVRPDRRSRRTALDQSFDQACCLDRAGVGLEPR